MAGDSELVVWKLAMAVSVMGYDVFGIVVDQETSGRKKYSEICLN
jgi:hypothetical protein